jgi:hypothetical protein
MQAIISLKSINIMGLFTTLIGNAGAVGQEELKIWISGEQLPSIKKQFNKSVNVYDVHKVLATHVLK